MKFLNKIAIPATILLSTISYGGDEKSLANEEKKQALEYRLYHASEKGDLKALKQALRDGADLKRKTKYLFHIPYEDRQKEGGASILQVACANEFWEGVRYLFRRGAKPHQTYTGYSALQQALKRNAPRDIIERLIGFQDTISDKDMEIAIKSDQGKALALMIDKGGNIKAQTSYFMSFKVSLLSLAVQHQSASCVKVLVKKGLLEKEVSEEKFDGDAYHSLLFHSMYPRAMIKRRNCLEIIKILINNMHEAEKPFQKRTLSYLIEKAKINQKKEVFLWLVKKYIDVSENKLPAQFKDHLWLLIDYCGIEVLDHLDKKQIAITQKQKDRALHAAAFAQNFNPKVFKRLLKMGAKLDSKNTWGLHNMKGIKWGKTIRQKAEILGRKDVFERLDTL